VFERWTNPKLVRRTCTCEYGLQSCRGKSAGVAKQPRERSPSRNPSRYDSQLFHRCKEEPQPQAGSVTQGMLEDVVAKYPLDHPAATALQLGLTCRRTMGGTSGVLYDIFFHAAAAQLKRHPVPATDGPRPTLASMPACDVCRTPLRQHKRCFATGNTNARTLTNQHGDHRQCRRNDATGLCSC
jgi:hypothetical protein